MLINTSPQDELFVAQWLSSLPQLPIYPLLLLILLALGDLVATSGQQPVSNRSSILLRYAVNAGQGVSHVGLELVKVLALLSELALELHELLLLALADSVVLLGLLPLGESVPVTT